MAIKHHFQNTSTQRAVIGLSGGVDSSVAAYLTVKALGPRRVDGLLLPEEGITPRADLEDGIRVAKELHIEHSRIPIDSVVHTIADLYPKPWDKNKQEGLLYPKALGNIKARARMLLLYAVANASNAQVIGTGDKSELLLGYFTKYGDGGVDILPLGDIYKSQVRYMASKLGLPARIWKKAPSPRLLPDQSAEGDIGVDYDLLDRILWRRVDYRYSDEKIAQELEIPLRLVKQVSDMITLSHHKRKAPPICKVGSATINWDWRMPVE
jgi:NAD+ synthase